jgi:hypothetical protein
MSKILRIKAGDVIVKGELNESSTAFVNRGSVYFMTG